jgi:hypothetical protein
MCLIVRSLEILSLCDTWREMLNVPSLIVLAYKHTKITEISIFVPCKNFGSNYSKLLLYLFSLLLLLFFLLLLLLHIILKDYFAMSVMDREFR